MKRTKAGDLVADRICRRATLTEDGCWEWTGHRDPRGYGRVSVTLEDGMYLSGVLAYRVSYRAFVGEVPEGLVLDHLCRNRACVNPWHLDPVTQQENIRRSPVSLQTINANKTHCYRGHAFTPENTEIRHRSDGRTQRDCIACRRPKTQGKSA